VSFSFNCWARKFNNITFFTSRIFYRKYYSGCSIECNFYLDRFKTSSKIERIIGGGVSGMQCALVLGSAKSKVFTADKKTGIIVHQKSSYLQNALFNNVLELLPKTLTDVLIDGK
jgi:hypothetical protein